MPLANFCSRLVVTSIRQMPNSQASGFRLSARRGPEFAAHRLVRNAARVQSPTTLGSRCRLTQPCVATQLTLCSPAAVRFTASPSDEETLARL